MRESVYTGVLTVVEHSTQRSHIHSVEVDNAEVCQRRFGEDNARNDENGACNKRSQRVRQNVSEHKSNVFCAQRSRGKYIFLSFEAVELHTHAVRRAYPACQDEYEQQSADCAGFARIDKMQFE